MRLQVRDATKRHDPALTPALTPAPVAAQGRADHRDISRIL